MPIERLRMRPWLENALNSHAYPGVEWVDEDLKIFRLPWKHASRNGWQIQKDASLFQAWAEHTGKYKGNDKPNPKTWKANFRCALNSLPDMEELVDRRTTKGNNAYKVYKIISNAEKKSYSKKLKARTKGKKRSFLRTRSVQKVVEMKKNNKTDAETKKSYANFCKPSISSEDELPQLLNINTTHLVDHDYALTRYFDLFNEPPTDKEINEVFDVSESEMIKTEPLSPNAIHAEDDFSLYEESRVDSKNVKTSCGQEDDRVMSDNEVVEMIDEMSSECGSTRDSIHDAMEELLEGCENPFDSDYSDNGKQRANSTPGMLETPIHPYTTIFCPLPSKVPRTKSSNDIQSMLNTTSSELLQSLCK